MSNCIDQEKTISIKRYFRGKHVFLTGCTGLLGKVIVEKILRCIPDIGSISLLIRPKETFNGEFINGKERFYTEIIKNPLFNKLRNLHGEAFDHLIAKKLHFIDGDLLQDHFGQDASTWKELCDRVDVVINSAATVNLFERLDQAISMNIEGPLGVLEFTRAADAVLIQISTAYVSGCINGTAREEIVDPQEAIESLEQVNIVAPENFDVEEEIARLKQVCVQVNAAGKAMANDEGWQPDSLELNAWVRNELVKAGLERSRGLGWMDTYTFTKFLGEQMLAIRRGSVPAIIVRPSIIESILESPEPGWLQKYRMADPVIVSFAKGRLFDFPGRADAPLDLIPVDLVVNGILASAAYLDGRGDDLEVVHISTSARNPLPLARFHTIKKKFFEEHPLHRKNGEKISVPDWRYLTTDEFFKKYEKQNGQGVKNKMRRIENGETKDKKEIRKIRSQWVEYEKISNMADQYSPYTTMNCQFEDRRAAMILESLQSQERKEFNFDPCQFTWEDYLSRVHIPGVRRNLLHIGD